MITILGATGFIGRHLATRLRELGTDCFCPGRNEPLTPRALGHVIYCIGLTADFRQRPYETVEAHVCKLGDVLRHCEFDSLLYLSSTRVYGLYGPLAKEEDTLRVSSSNSGDLYNISKLMGESLALSSSRSTRVARLSNVYGDDFSSNNFLNSIVRDAVCSGKVTLRTTLDSAKDYVGVRDVVNCLIKIVTNGKSRVYNVAAGFNVSNRELAEALQSLTGCEVSVTRDAKQKVLPTIDVGRIRGEFDFTPGSLLDEMPTLVETCRRR